MLPGELLRPGVDAPNPLQAHGVHGLLQKVDALSQAVQQGQVKIRLQQPQGHSRESGPGAYVHHLLAPEVRRRQQAGAVQQVQPRHVCRFGDGSQVHDLVLLQQPPGKLRQRRDASCVQSQLGQTLFQNGFQITSAPSAGPGSPPAAPQWWDRQAPPAQAPHPSSSGQPACSWLSPAGTWQRPR